MASNGKRLKLAEQLERRAGAPQGSDKLACAMEAKDVV